jgi:hypothetical protein
MLTKLIVKVHCISATVSRLLWRFSLAENRHDVLSNAFSSLVFAACKVYFA